MDENKVNSQENYEEVEETREEFIARINREKEERLKRKAEEKLKGETEPTPIPEEDAPAEKIVDEDEEPVEEVKNDDPPTGKLLGELDLIYEEHDIIAATDIQLAKSKALKIFRIILVLLPAAMLIYSIIKLCLGDTTQVSNIVLCALLYIFVGYIYFVSPKKTAHRTFMGIDEDQKNGIFNHFSFYEGGVYITTPTVSQTFEWSQFREIVECPAGILLTTFGRSAVYFPERLLGNVDRKALSEVMMKELGNKYFVTDFVDKATKKKENI